MDSRAVPRIPRTHTRHSSVISRLFPRILPYAALTTAVVTLLFAGAHPAYAISEPIFDLSSEDPQSTAPSTAFEMVFDLLNKDIMQLPFWLFSWIFRALCGVLFTLPNWFFTSPWFLHAFYVMCGLALSATAIMAAWSGFKRGVGVRVTAVPSAMLRLPLVFAALGFAPFLLERGTYYLNQVTLAVEKFGFYTLKDTTSFDVAIGNVFHTLQIDFWAMLVFDGILLYEFFPIMLKAGQRWFDMLMLGVISPLALCSFTFDETKHYGKQWWRGVKSIAVSQLYQVGFLAFLILLMFGTKGITSGGDLFIRLLVLVGGFHRMKNPPPLARGGSSGMFKKFEDKYKGGVSNLWKSIRRDKQEGEKEKKKGGGKGGIE